MIGGAFPCRKVVCDTLPSTKCVHLCPKFTDIELLICLKDIRILSSVLVSIISLSDTPCCVGVRRCAQNHILLPLYGFLVVPITPLWILG